MGEKGTKEKKKRKKVWYSKSVHSYSVIQYYIHGTSYCYLLLIKKKNITISLE